MVPTASKTKTTQKMPISDEAAGPVVSYRQKYRNLKRKLKYLLYENECFQEELRKAQRKLLKVTRDKSFLLDQLLQYESIDSSSSDSDATLSSDSESELRVEPPPPPAAKKKKLSVAPVDASSVHHLPSVSAAVVPSASPSCSIAIKTEIVPGPGPSGAASLGVLPTLAAKSTVLMPPGASLNPTAEKKKKVARATKPAATVSAPPQPLPKQLLAAGIPKRMVEVADALAVGRLDGHMTSEEVERHLEARQALRDLLPEKAPLTVPAELFSNEPPAELLDSGPPLLVATTSVMASADAEADEDELITGLPD